MFVLYVFCFFFFKQKTAYEMRISDWSSDVCSSDLISWLHSTSSSRSNSRNWPPHNTAPRHWNGLASPCRRNGRVSSSSSSSATVRATAGHAESGDRKSVVEGKRV